MSAKVSGSLGTTTKAWKDECVCSEWTRVVKDRVSKTPRAGSAGVPTPGSQGHLSSHKQFHEAVGCAQGTEGDRLYSLKPCTMTACTPWKVYILYSQHTSTYFLT